MHHRNRFPSSPPSPPPPLLSTTSASYQVFRNMIHRRPYLRSPEMSLVATESEHSRRPPPHQQGAVPSLVQLRVDSHTNDAHGDACDCDECTRPPLGLAPSPLTIDPDRERLLGGTTAIGAQSCGRGTTAVLEDYNYGLMCCCTCLFPFPCSLYIPMTYFCCPAEMPRMFKRYKCVSDTRLPPTMIPVVKGTRVGDPSSTSKSTTAASKKGAVAQPTQSDYSCQDCQTDVVCNDIFFCCLCCAGQ